MQLTVSLIQTTSVNDLAANIAAIAPMVSQAKAEGAALIALPENAFYMRERGDGAPFAYGEEEHPGVLAAREWAVKLGVWILVGSVAIAPEDKNGGCPR